MTPHAALTTAAPSVRSLAVPAWFDAARRIAVGLMLTLAAGLKLTDPPRAVDDPGGLAAVLLWGNPTPCGCFGRGGQEPLTTALVRNALVLTMLAPPARPKHPPR